MNKKIFENARFCPKGDIEANWNKAVGFIPLKKEIIEYLPDENHAAARFKVGDGTTPVQDLPFAGADDREIKAYIDSKIETISQADYEQNDETAQDYIKNRPFYEEKDKLIPPITYTFDGNLEGKEYADLEGSYLVKISEDIPPIESLIGGQTTALLGDELITETISNVYDDDGAYFLDVEDVIIVIDAQAVADFLGYPIPGPGIYFGYYPGNYMQTELITAAYTGSFIQPLDEKFIPKSIARISDVVSKRGGIITGALTIKGDLTVHGTNTAITTQTLNVKDNIIVANSDGVELIDNAGFAVKTGLRVNHAGGAPGTPWFDTAYGIMYDVQGDGVKIGLGEIDSNDVFKYNEGEAQFLATRADYIENGNIPQWNNKTKKFVDSGISAVKISQTATTKQILKLFDEEVVL